MAAIYTSWFLIIWFHAYIPWYLMILIAGYILAWHFSLQHEAIHGWRGIPRWLRFAVVWPPIGGWFSFELYRKSHSTHHRNTYLTYPGQDTECYYIKTADWDRFNPIWRGVMLFHQTFVGRLLIGPLLRWRKLLIIEFGLLFRGEFRNVPVWLRHFATLAVMFWFVEYVCGMPAWQYVVLCIYPGLSLSLLRAFIEHRWGERPGHRTASVESNWLFGLLFLWNNLHIAHHLHPTMLWYQIPRFYRENKDKLMAHNNHFIFRGYGEIALRWLFKPVFLPAHPMR